MNNNINRKGKIKIDRKGKGKYKETTEKLRNLK